MNPRPMGNQRLKLRKEALTKLTRTNWNRSRKASLVWKNRQRVEQTRGNRNLIELSPARTRLIRAALVNRPALFLETLLTHPSWERTIEGPTTWVHTLPWTHWNRRITRNRSMKQKLNRKVCNLPILLYRAK